MPPSPIFRAAQEALSNVARHARATKVEGLFGRCLAALHSACERQWLRLRHQLHVRAAWDWRTCARAPPNWGGEFELISQPGCGTTVEFTVPFSVPDPQRLRRKLITSAVLLCLSLLVAWKLHAVGLAGLSGAIAVVLIRDALRYQSMRQQEREAFMSVIHIVLVDDHRVVTRSLKAYLESFPDICVTGIAASGEELLAHVDEWRPDVVLQDLLLPGGIDGVETTRRLLQQAPSVKVVALTASIDEARMMGVLRAGARGYVRKDADPRDAAGRRAHRGPRQDVHRSIGWRHPSCAGRASIWSPRARPTC